MEIILLETIDRLGGLGDLVNVRSGYARNYLLPQGKAKIANSENIAEIEVRRTELEKQSANLLDAANGKRTHLESLEVSITAKAGSEGKLFGSVGNIDISEAITAAGVEVAKREVRLPDGPIHEVGEYEIDVHLYADVDAKVKLVIIGEE